MKYSGKAIKILANFYYIEDSSGKIWECSARSRLFKEGKKICVGDVLDIEPSNEKQAVIIDVQHRKNSMTKPPASNIDQVLVVFSSLEPEFDFYNLDRYITFISHKLKNVEITICINKIDLKEINIYDNYKESGYQIFLVSAHKKMGLNELFTQIKNKNTVLTGPSGVGKSSLIKAFAPNYEIRIGSINSINRGKHTTRNVELVRVEQGSESGHLFDTPGFTLFNFEEISKEDILNAFPEFSKTECEFKNCFHEGEEGCFMLNTEKKKMYISDSRYESYIKILKDSESKDNYSKKDESKLKYVGGNKQKKIIPKINKLDRSKSRRTKKQKLNQINEDFQEE